MDLEGRVAVLEVRMDSVQGTFSELTGSVAQVRDRLDSLSSDLARMDNKFEKRLGEMEGRFGEILVLMERRFGDVQRDFAVVHREIRNQTRFLLVLALASATVVSVLHPLMKSLLGQ